MEKLKGQSRERVNRLHVSSFKRLGRGELAKEKRGEKAMTERSRFNEKGLNGVFIARIYWTFVLGALLLNSAALLRAQEVTAGFAGTVTDPSGAPIPEVTVTAQDTLRGVPYTTKTNNVGVFDLPRLPVSTYDLTVEAKGFATAVRRSITLEMNQKARVDFQLQIGALTQQIEVSAAPPLLQTDTMEVGTVITGKVNVDLPLATRNYIELTMLAPGTTNPNPGEMTNGLTTASGGRPYVNGNREQSDNFMLDGIDNNQVSDNLVGYTPSVDAIQEFNMISNNAPAEFGNFQGGIISASIKSGTNQLHGVGFEFLRNDVLNAAQWSDNISNSPKAKMRWNMFGGTVGGPIKKDKLFFFGDYQGERFDFPASVGAVNVFTAKERAGDFSEVCPGDDFNSAGVCQKGIQLYDPTHVDASGHRALIPFNNLAAAGLTEDAVAKNLFSSSTLYPAPIGPGLTYNQTNTSHSAIIGDQFDVKIDANLSQKDRIFGRASWSRLNNPGTNSFPLFYNSFSNAPTKSLGLDWTRTISPALVNEVRVGGNYVTTLNGGADKGLGNVGTTLGIAGANERGPGLPGIDGFTYASGIGSANVGTQQDFPSTVLQAEDTLVITHGRHVLHTGFQFFRQRIDPFYAGNYGRTGNITFDGRWTAGPADNATSGGGSGFPEADFWLGLPEDVQRGVDTGTWGQRSSVLAAYVQDDWRATDQLTLNLGLRYETHTPWGEVHNRQANFGMITGTEYFSGQSCPYSDCNALYNSYNGGFDFQPRIGFAWTPSALNKKVVIRGAYTTSSYLEGTGTNLRLTLNPPFNLEHDAKYDSLTYPGSTIDQGFSVFAPTNPSTSAPVDFAGAVIRLWNPDIKPSLAQQWNFSTEYQFPHDTVLTLMYLGQHATHLMNPMPYFQRRVVGEAGCTAAGAVILSGGTIPTCQSPYLSGNPAMGTNSNPIIAQISGTESNANMVYHALQVILRKRLSQGLQYQVAYTYSKCMTNSIGYYGSWGGQVVPAAAYWQNLYDGRSEWAPCESNVTNLLSSYAVYELPFGHKMHFGSNWNSVANGVLGNWQVSGILQVRGGFPSTVSAGDASGTGGRSPRADCLGPPTYAGGTPVSTGGIQWVNPDSFGPELPGAFGTCSVDGFTGPGLRTFDLSVQKSFAITESKRIEFRSEFINFTNTPIFNAPSTYIGAGFGQITSSQGARNIQFGLKIYY